MLSGTGRYRRRRLVLRLLRPAGANGHQHGGSHFEAVSRQGGVPQYLRETFQEAKIETETRGLRSTDLMEMLKIVLASLPQVFICIDALDEFLPKDLPELLESLRDIVRESSRTHIFLTGRSHVKEAVQRCFTKAVVILISPKMGGAILGVG